MARKTTATGTKIYNAEALAEILGMEKAAAVRLMRGEDFPATYIEAGDVYVVDQANLAKWVAAHARRVEGVNDTLFDVI